MRLSTRYLCLMLLGMPWCAFAAQTEPYQAAIPDTLRELIDTREQRPTHAVGHYVACVFDQAGLEVQWSALPPARMVRYLRSNTLQFGVLMQRNAARDSDAVPSQPLMVNSERLYFKPERGVGPDTLAYNSIALIVGDPRKTYFEQLGNQNIVEVREFRQITDLVLQGRVDAFASAESVFQLKLLPQRPELKALDSLEYQRSVAVIYLSFDTAAKPGVLEQLNAAIGPCQQRWLADSP